MGIGPGPVCNFNSLDLTDIITPETSNLADEQYLNAVSGDLYPSRVNPGSFVGIELSMTDRTRTANAIARVIKEDNASTANGPPSCNQFNEIAQV